MELAKVSEADKKARAKQIFFLQPKTSVQTIAAAVGVDARQILEWKQAEGWTLERQRMRRQRSRELLERVMSSEEYAALVVEACDLILKSCVKDLKESLSVSDRKMVMDTMKVARQVRDDAADRLGVKLSLEE